MRSWPRFVALPLLLAAGIVLGLQSPAAAPIVDPPSAGPVHFMLDAQGVGLFQFSRCAGIGSETDITELNEGGGGNVSFLPGATTPLQLTCMRGYDDDPTLAQWRQDVADGDVDLNAGSLVMFDTAGEEIGRWNYIDIWPRLLVVQLDGSGIPYEVVTFVSDYTFIP